MNKMRFLTSWKISIYIWYPTSGHMRPLPPGPLNSDRGRLPAREQGCSKPPPFFFRKIVINTVLIFRAECLRGQLAKSKEKLVGKVCSVQSWPFLDLFRVLDTRSLKLNTQNPGLWKATHSRHWGSSVFSFDCLSLPKTDWQWFAPCPSPSV